MRKTARAAFCAAVTAMALLCGSAANAESSCADLKPADQLHDKVKKLAEIPIKAFKEGCDMKRTLTFRKVEKPLLKELDKFQKAVEYDAKDMRNLKDHAKYLVKKRPNADLCTKEARDIVVSEFVMYMVPALNWYSKTKNRKAVCLYLEDEGAERIAKLVKTAME